MGKRTKEDGTREESQAERFERAAREHDVEVDEKKLAEMLRRMAKREKEKRAKNDGE